MPISGGSALAQQPIPGQQPIPARGLPPVPAWAWSPTTNDWAGQAAQLLNPPELKVAHAAARHPPPSICRSTAEIQPAEIGAV
jgi:hypothetical protein